MKTRYKIIIIGIIFISIIWFLGSSSFFGQPRCWNEIIIHDGPNMDVEGDCKSWNNWDWIYYHIFAEKDIMGFCKKGDIYKDGMCFVNP